MQHHFKYHPCAHVAVFFSCHVECNELETNPSLPHLKIVLQFSRYQTIGGTSKIVFSRSDTCIDVIENFKSHELVKYAIAGMLSYLEGLDHVCVDFVTECHDLVDDVVTGSIDGDNIRRIPATKSNMSCLHIFHSPCLTTWLHESNSFPVCLHQVDPDG
ncbi:hypothetical protein MKX03_021830 [Papaver bracteatum]|nr:hypothetical protein MKX03_021830 [Papaver bracteatum]